MNGQLQVFSTRSAHAHLHRGTICAASLDMSRWSREQSLPKHVYARGNRLWIRLLDERDQWMSRSTGLNLEQVDQVQAVLEAAQAAVAAKKALLADPTKSVQGFVESWLADREARGVASVVDERGRLEKYALPTLGHMLLVELKPKHVRELIRTLRAMPKEERLAPRTILHIYTALHNAMESAVFEELIATNPVAILPHELPKRIDKDSEWRSQATYNLEEVERLLSDSRVAFDRRVLYALKSLAGLRHGEAAALCWRHRDTHATPLARINVTRSYCSRTGSIKSTKDEMTRAVPEHPTLTKVLDAWRAEWTRVHGREPGPDDLIVPGVGMEPVHVKAAGHAMKKDLKELGLRVSAGEIRDRGGHDLRSFFKTRTIEDGGDYVVIRRTTHASDKSVDGGYERFSWATLCREVAKLRVEVR